MIGCVKLMFLVVLLCSKKGGIEMDFERRRRELKKATEMEISVIIGNLFVGYQ